MKFEEIMEIINERWCEQSNYQTSFLETVHLPYEIFKKNRKKLKEINYMFDPNVYNEIDGYFPIYIKCSFNEKIQFEYN